MNKLLRLLLRGLTRNKDNDYVEEVINVSLLPIPNSNSSQPLEQNSQNQS